MNEEILKKLGYNSIALEMLLKREAQININPEDILMPGERPSINKDPSLNDVSSDVKSDVENIINKLEEVKELQPGHALIVNALGKVKEANILPAQEKKACSFERIYFSRGSDAAIYKERMQLGKNLAANVLDAIENDLKNTIVSFIPNTAEIAFYGLIN